MKNTLWNRLLRIWFNFFMIFLKFIYFFAPMNRFLLMFTFTMLSILHTALPMLGTYCIHYWLNHFLLLLLIELFWLLLVFFIVASLERDIDLLLFSLFYYIFYIPHLQLTLPCLFYNIHLLRILLFIFFYIFFQFYSVSNRYIFPFVNLLLSEIVQLLNSKHSFFFELSANSLHLDFD
jgi:hypothetical protein